jgi:hypothetical protein
VAEWSIALVLKTSKGQPFVSSNLTASAKIPYQGDFFWAEILWETLKSRHNAMARWFFKRFLARPEGF